MLFSMQMKYKLIRSVIFYSEGLSSKRGTHLSLISLVSHVMWDWSEREPLWLPATQLFAAAQCHCHSTAVLMCSFLSTSINVTLGRHARKWKAEQGSKIGKRETLHLCFRCTWTLERQYKSDRRAFFSLSRSALAGLSLNFSFEMLFSYSEEVAYKQNVLQLLS